MKKILLAIFAAAVALSCVKEGGQQGGNDTPAGSNTPITLSASTTAPDMSVDTQNSEVLTLTWNATTNMGTGARITYSLLADIEGGSFETPYEKELGPNVTSVSFTAGELNKIIKEEFDFENGQTAKLDVLVLATIANAEVDDVLSNKVTITLVAFEPKPTALYMIGSATAAGWDLASAIDMTPIEGEEGGFTWSGELTGGELKFLVTKDGWVPSYGREDDTHLYLRDHLWDDPDTGERVDDESLPHVDSRDDKFIIPEQGNYKIELNIDKLTITITKTGGPKYYSMYMFGSGLEKQPVQMYRSGYAFFKGVKSADAYVHFTADVNNNKDFYYAVEDNQSLDNHSVSQSTYYEFHLPAGLYHASLYVKEGKEAAYFVKYTPYDEIYLIGSACDAGWGIANALPMTKKSATVQTWSGNLKAGELKFTCDKSEDWFGAWYLASEAGKAPAGVEEPIIFIDKARAETSAMGIKDLDQKWNITDPGSYSITLDQENETVIIKKN